MTKDDVIDTVSRIQHHLDTAANDYAALIEAHAWEIMEMTKTAFAQYVFGDNLKPEAARQRLYRAIRAVEMRAELSELMSIDDTRHMSHPDPAAIPDTTINALYRVEQAARLTVIKAAYRDNGGIVTMHAIQEAAEAVAEYGVFNTLPDGEGGQIKAHEAISDLLYVQAANRRRMDSKTTWVLSRASARIGSVIGGSGTMAMINFKDDLYQLLRNDLDGKQIVISIGVEGESADHDR